MVSDTVKSALFELLECAFPSQKCPSPGTLSSDINQEKEPPWRAESLEGGGCTGKISHSGTTRAKQHPDSETAKTPPSPLVTLPFQD